MKTACMWASIAALSIAVAVLAVSQFRGASPEYPALRELKFTGGAGIIQTSLAPESVTKANGPPTSVYEQAKGAVFQVLGSDGKPLGTAFLHTSGWVITPYHVIAGSPEGLSIRTLQGTTQPVILWMVDKDQDIALLMLTKALDDIRPLVLADSSTLRVGQPVLLIGSPFGIFQTATAGIISGLGRDGARFATTCPNCTKLVQTDAAAGPGSSGSPLLDEEGRVIGMHILGVKHGIYGETNFNFAASTDHIKSLVDAANAAR